MTDRKDAPRVRRGFAQANPAAYARAQGRAQMVSQLRAVDERTAAVKQRMREHCQRKEETWVSTEAMRLWKERASWAEKHKAPAKAAAEAMSPKQMETLARRNIKARIGERLSNINRIGERMRATITSTLKATTPEQEPTLREKFKKANRVRIE